MISSPVRHRPPCRLMRQHQRINHHHDNLNVNKATTNHHASPHSHGRLPQGLTVAPMGKSGPSHDNLPRLIGRAAYSVQPLGKHSCTQPLPFSFARVNFRKYIATAFPRRGRPVFSSSPHHPGRKRQGITTNDLFLGPVNLLCVSQSLSKELSFCSVVLEDFV